MAKRDYYEVLGLDKSASAADLKSAFRKKAMLYHPDRNPDDESASGKFKELNEAYQVLSDEQKRAAYDQMGHAAFEGGGGRPGEAGFGMDFSSSMSDIFEDLFGDFMGGGRSRSSRQGGRQRGSDLRQDHEITLEEVYNGTEVDIPVQTVVPCETCDGSGAKPGTSPTTCRTCGGAGRVRTNSGFLSIERTCSTCQGQGERIEDPCRECSGTGRKTKKRSLSVRIPAGVEDGTRIRLNGEGEAGFRGGPSGDLYVFLSVKPHAFFRRNGQDIACSVPIPMAQAALGGEFEVPTIDGGKSKVKVPEGVQSGTKLRLKGKGMPSHRTRHVGDMHVEISVETPRNLSKEQRELLQQFQNLSSKKNSPDASRFFDRVKDLWTSLSS